MAAERAKTALSNIEERIRKVLGLAGAYSLGLTEELVLQVKSGDLTGPGCSTYKGRRFMYASPATTNMAANFGWGLTITDHVILTSIWCAVPANPAAAITNMEIWMLAPDVAPATAMTTRGGTWVDGKLVTTTSERPPIFLTAEAASSLAGETAPTSVQRIMSVPLSTGGPRFVQLPLEMYLPPNSSILARQTNAIVTADQTCFGFSGMIRPF